MVGQTLGHYKILDKLGAGGMGEVYRAEDTTLKRQVALKVLPPDLAASQERLDRFQREAKTLAALNHPNIVHVYSVEEDKGTHFLTMELVEGQPLSDLIKTGGLPLKRIFEIATPLADALATAHEKGVIHRDLKPANIMVTDEGRVKILDFGLAKLRQEAEVPLATELPTEPLTEEGRIVGTMPYMSPEQLEGKDIDARSDIFSLGVVLYEMATGERPFQGDSTASLITAIMSHSPRGVDSLRTEVPHHLSRVIAHCLEKGADHRYQSAKDVRNELSHLERELESVGSETRVTESRRRSRFTAKRPMAVAAILLALLAGFLYLSYQLVDRAKDGAPTRTGPESQWLDEITDPEARLLFAQFQSYSSQGPIKRDLAESSLRAALTREPKGPFLTGELALFLAGYCWSRQPGSSIAPCEESASLAEAALAADPENAAAWLARAQLMRAEGKSEEAIQLAQRAQSLEPEIARSYVLLGRLLLDTGMTEEGLEQFRRGEVRDGGAISAGYALGNALGRLGRLDEAALQLKRVLEFAPDHVATIGALANVYLVSGRYLEAVPLYRRAIEFQPTRRNLTNLATAYQRLGRYEEAIQAYLEAEQLEPGVPITRMNLGDAYLAVDDEEEAKFWYQKAQESADAEVEKGNQRFLQIRAVSAARLGLYDRAIRDITKVVSEHPDDPQSLFSAAEIYALAEMKDEAMEYVEQAMRAGHPRAEFDGKTWEVLADDPEFQALLVADLEKN